MQELGIPAWLPLSDAVSLVGPHIGAGAFSDPTSSVDTDAQSSFKDELAPLGFVRSGCLPAPPPLRLFHVFPRSGTLDLLHFVRPRARGMHSFSAPGGGYSLRK